MKRGSKYRGPNELPGDDDAPRAARGRDAPAPQREEPDDDAEEGSARAGQRGLSARRRVEIIVEVIFEVIEVVVFDLTVRVEACLVLARERADGALGAGGVCGDRRRSRRCAAHRGLGRVDREWCGPAGDV